MSDIRHTVKYLKFSNEELSVKKTDENELDISEPEKKDKVDRRIKKTLNAIYSSATQLFGEKEFNEITMEQIAERADISRATLYTHFKNKAEIYFQIGYDQFKSINDSLKAVSWSRT